MPKRLLIAAAAVMLVEMQVMAIAGETKINLGRLMQSAFECSTYAELSKNPNEQARLFHVGYAAGEEFVDGVRKKSIPKAEIQEAPLVVLMELGGPTNDFIIGRIFEGAQNDAFDAVVKEDKSGTPLAPAEWVIDDKRKAIRAETKYLQSNCAIIQLPGK